MLRVPADTAVGNVSLRSQLSHIGWSESLYWDIRKHLIQRGVLASGHGRGGSVRRVTQAIAQDNDAPPAPTNDAFTEADNVSRQYTDEEQLYQPMREAIK